MIAEQKLHYDKIYNDHEPSRWDFYFTDDPLVRFLVDRRLEIAYQTLKANDKTFSDEDSLLIVCGGVGGDALFFQKKGFKNITNSDFFEGIEERTEQIFDGNVKGLNLNAQQMNIPDNSFDYVLVQDGLHHLPSPVQGLTEMIRVAKKGVIVIEPHKGIISKMFGMEWEKYEESVNWVFRWDKNLFTQVIHSYLLKSYNKIIVLKFWDHNVSITKLASKFPKKMRLNIAKLAYKILQFIFPTMGNMFIGILLKR